MVKKDHLGLVALELNSEGKIAEKVYGKAKRCEIFWELRVAGSVMRSQKYVNLAWKKDPELDLNGWAFIHVFNQTIQPSCFYLGEKQTQPVAESDVSGPTFL